jgi:N-acylneuraminate cytidylyltransferase
MEINLSQPDSCSAVAIIFARGGSKGLPNKNIKIFAGRPLISWAIDCARKSRSIRRVIVSTDSSEIAEIAVESGAEVPFMRPSRLAEDDSPEFLAWRHALEFIRDDEGSLPAAMVSLPATAPLREVMDVELCLERFYEGNADAVITVTDAYRNPYFNMVKKYSDGSVGVVLTPDGGIYRRQDAPKVYDMTTVAYVLNPQFVMSHDSVFAGRVEAVHVPTERSIDIDSLLDFEMAEFLFSRGSNR